MKSLRALFGLAVVVGMVYGGALFLPLYFNNYQFQDDLNTESHFDSTGTGNKDDEAIRQAVLKKANDYKITLNPDNIHIDRSGPEVGIWAEYNVMVHLPTGKNVIIKFRPHSQNAKPPETQS